MSGQDFFYLVSAEELNFFSKLFFNNFASGILGLDVVKMYFEEKFLEGAEVERLILMDHILIHSSRYSILKYEYYFCFKWDITLFLDILFSSFIYLYIYFFYYFYFYFWIIFVKIHYFMILDYNTYCIIPMFYPKYFEYFEYFIILIISIIIIFFVHGYKGMSNLIADYIHTNDIGYKTIIIYIIIIFIIILFLSICCYWVYIHMII